MNTDNQNERGANPRRRLLVRIGLVLSVAVVIAMELTRPEPPPPPSPREGAAAEPVAPTPVKPGADLVVKVGFDRLGAYPVKMPELIETPEGLIVHATGSITNQIPPVIRALNGRQVVVTGFMQPLSLRNGQVNEFLLFRDRGTCCFGGTPQINHWIGVLLTNGMTAAKLGRPVAVEGRLDVDEIRTEGVLVGLYRIAASRVSDPDPAKQ
jgi:hypothetical protein